MTKARMDIDRKGMENVAVELTLTMAVREWLQLYENLSKQRDWPNGELRDLIYDTIGKLQQTIFPEQK